MRVTKEAHTNPQQYLVETDEGVAVLQLITGEDPFCFQVWEYTYDPEEPLGSLELDPLTGVWRLYTGPGALDHRHPIYPDVLRPLFDRVRPRAEAEYRAEVART